jgi:hypothetical protein
MTHKTQTNNAVDLFNGYTPALPSKEQLKDVFYRISEFQSKLRVEPDKAMIDRTPDGRAETLVISAVENSLDEMFSGLWSATNFHWQVVSNEVVGCITLRVFHPECGVWIERDGAGAIQIMVDKGANPLDITSKKGNALNTGFPKLKSECLKNAAKSLGDVFGRNLNRKKADTNFEPLTDKDESNSVREQIAELLKTVDVKPSEKATIESLIANSETNYTRLLGILQNLKTRK